MRSERLDLQARPYRCKSHQYCVRSSSRTTLIAWVSARASANAALAFFCISSGSTPQRSASALLEYNRSREEIVRLGRCLRVENVVKAVPQASVLPPGQNSRNYAVKAVPQASVLPPGQNSRN